MSHSVTTRRTTAAREAGMSRRQMYAALAIARIPAEEFERLIESDNPPSVRNLDTLGRKRINVSQRLSNTPKRCTRYVTSNVWRSHWHEPAGGPHGMG